MSSIRIGVSGWRYVPWRGVFYPDGLPHRQELAYASRCFNAIELNGSFYSLQRPENYAAWHAETPPGFVFAVKGGRYITHMLKLRECEEAVANFFASGVLCLREKLGPILWQFPANFVFNAGRLEPFLATLPRDTRAALALAGRHASWMRDRVHLEIDAVRPMRHAIEVRNESFRNPAFVELLREHGVALVVAEGARQWPLFEDITADFTYLRLHGHKQLYKSGYGRRALERWAARIRAWQRGGTPADAQQIVPGRPARLPRDVYCFFDNTDVKLRAPADARHLMRLLRVAPACDSARQPRRPAGVAAASPRPQTGQSGQG